MNFRISGAGIGKLTEMKGPADKGIKDQKSAVSNSIFSRGKESFGTTFSGRKITRLFSAHSRTCAKVAAIVATGVVLALGTAAYMNPEFINSFNPKCEDDFGDQNVSRENSALDQFKGDISSFLQNSLNFSYACISDGCREVSNLWESTVSFPTNTLDVVEKARKMPFHIWSKMDLWVFNTCTEVLSKDAPNAVLKWSSNVVELVQSDLKI